jgi:hypothetical protein
MPYSPKSRARIWEYHAETAEDAAYLLVAKIAATLKDAEMVQLSATFTKDVSGQVVGRVTIVPFESTKASKSPAVRTTR